MPRALTAPTVEAVERRVSGFDIYLALTLWRDRFGASPTSTTLRLSDRYRVAMGEEWLPGVVSWGSLTDALEMLGPGGSVGLIDVLLANGQRLDTPGGTIAVDRFSDLERHGLNTEGWDLAFADATLFLLQAGSTDVADAIPFRLSVEELTEITAQTCVLRISGIAGALDDVDPLYRVLTADFSSADPDAVGQIVPWLLGPLRGVPLLAVDAGLAHVLAGDITATSPANGGALGLSDATQLARMPASGTVQVDAEQIAYTGLDTSTVSLTGITRGAASTLAVPHTRGAVVYQVQSTYRYLLAENPTAGLFRTRTTGLVLYADGARIDPATYTVTWHETALVTGRSFVAVAFTVLPTIRRQVILAADVSDTIGVSDTIAVLDGIGVSDTIGAETVSVETLVMHPSGTFPQTVLSYQSNTWIFSKPTLPGGGSIQNVYAEIHVNIEQVGSPTNVGLDWSPGFGSGLEIYATDGAGAQTKNTGGGSADGGTVFSAQQLSWDGTHTASNHLRISVQSVVWILRRSLPITKTGAASKTGAATKGGAATKTGTVGVGLVGNSAADVVLGQITADVSGIEDDASGTISGTPGLLLENPADVIRLLLREHYGETSAGLYASWATARASFAGAGLTWALIWRGARFRDFRELLGRHSLAELVQDAGLWHLLPFGAQSPPAMTFDARNCVNVRIGKSPRTDIVTRLTVVSDPEPDAHGGIARWRASAEWTDPSASDAWGRRRGRVDAAPTLELPWIRDAATATAIGGHWWQRRSHPWQTLQLEGFWDALRLMPCDTIAADLPVLTPFGGTAVAWMVRRLQLRTAPVRVWLEAVEIGVVAE